MSPFPNMIFISKRKRGEAISPHPILRKPRVPAGVRAYGIGDVHGCDDLLADILNKIRDDIAHRSFAKNHIVVLGDLIDRGPDSRGVIERLRCFSEEGCELHVLAGNHEEVILRLLQGRYGIFANWLKFGGTETLESYDVTPDEISTMNEKDGLRLIKSVIPKNHQEFLRRMNNTVLIGDYLFVHAGIRPGIDLEEQTQADMRWIRQPFLDSEIDHGFVVIHGHTIAEQVIRRHNRIGIDTGAYASGRLTAIALEGEEQWFLEATGGQR